MNTLRFIKSRSIWPSLLLSFCCFAGNGYAAGKIIGWGVRGKLPDFTDIVAISAGDLHSLALRSNGTVVAWGQNDYEQSNVPSGLSNVVAIAAGASHNLALKADGTVTAWGLNDRGQCNVPSDLANVRAVSAGYNESLALRSDGTVAAWGYGYDYPEQAKVLFGLTNIASVASGYRHSLALRTDGSVVVWGYIFLYLGPPYILPQPAALTNVVAIAAGGDKSLVLRADGGIVEWAKDGTVQTNVPSSLTNVAAIATGGHHSVALTTAGTVVAWGSDFYGAASVPADLSNVVAVAAGSESSLALIAHWTPTVVLQPVGGQAYAGREHSLTVGAEASDPLSYQWRFNDADLPGATDSVLSFRFVTPADAGAYSVLITSQFGSTLSQPAILTVVQGPPIITLQPTNRQSSVQPVRLILIVTIAARTSLCAGPPTIYPWSDQPMLGQCPPPLAD